MVETDVDVVVELHVGTVLINVNLTLLAGDDLSGVLDALWEAENLPIYLRPSAEICSRELLSGLRRECSDSPSLDSHAKMRVGGAGYSFSSCFRRLVRSPASSRAVLVMHNRCRDAMRVLVSRRDAAVGEVEKEQEAELRNALLRATLSSGDESRARIEKAATRHQEVVRRVANEWKPRVDAMRKRQREEFRDFIYKLNSVEVARHGGSVGNDDASDAAVSVASSLWRRYDVVGTSGCAVPARVGTVYVGKSQLKKSTRIVARVGNLVEDYCTDPALSEDPKQVLTLLQTLYGDDLAAVLLCCRASNALRGSCIPVGLRRALAGAADVHFAEIGTQFSDAVAQVQKSKQLESGEAFITKHSILAAAHLLIHLVVDALGSEECVDGLVSGLRNVLVTAGRGGVTCVAIPPQLLCKVEEDEEALQRAFNVVASAMRAALDDVTFEVIHFVLPTSATESTLDRLWDTLASVFHHIDSVIE